MTAQVEQKGNENEHHNEPTGVESAPVREYTIEDIAAEILNIHPEWSLPEKFCYCVRTLNPNRDTVPAATGTADAFNILVLTERPAESNVETIRNLAHWDVIETKPLTLRSLAVSVLTALERRNEIQNMYEGLVRKIERWERSFLDVLPDIVYELDLNGRLRYVNPAVAKLGYAPEDLIGQDFAVLVHPDDWDQVNRSAAIELHKQGTMRPPATGVIDERRTEGRGTSGLPVRLVHKNGTDILPHIASAVGFCKKKVAGRLEVNGTLGLLHDQTDKQRCTDLQSEKEMLEQYFSPDVIRMLKTKGERDLMMSEKVKASILFLDVRNFTSISETISPEKVADLLNRIYTDLMALIAKNGGSTNKIMGDALLATFGCPLPLDTPATGAVKTALDILETVEFFNQVRPEYLRDPLEVGIGIATGDIFAGNIGSYHHKEYTVIGDPVNMASRLESLTKRLPADILADRETQEALIGTDFEVQEFKNVPVKGKAGFQTIYGIQKPTAQTAGGGISLF